MPEILIKLKILHPLNCQQVSEPVGKMSCEMLANFFWFFLNSFMCRRPVESVIEIHNWDSNYFFGHIFIGNRNFDNLILIKKFFALVLISQAACFVYHPCRALSNHSD